MNILVATLLAFPGALGQQLQVQQKTNSPISAPTAMPSDSPSSLPTQFPTKSQVPTTSHAPTATNQPTNIRSNAPTLATGAPSKIPSLAPTTAPTLACHDVASYRSPINALQCEDHAGTDCFQWSYLDLNPDQVEELINSCPISCNIPCGSLLNFDVELDFVLQHVDTYLAQETTDIIEEVTLDYLMRYSRPQSPESRFTMHGVQLNSQDVADGSESNKTDADATRRWIRRREQEENQIDLMVSFGYRGFALHLNETEVKDILREGIFSPGYARMLRITDVWALRNVEIAELTDPIKDNLPGQSDPNTIVMNDDGSLSAGAIVACVFSALVILSVSGAFLFLQRRKHRTLLDPDFSFDKNDDELDSELNSPAGSARSPLRDVLSFDSVIRLMTSIGGGGGTESRSASPTDLEGDSTTDQKSRQSKDVQSKESDDGGDDDDDDDGFFEEEHPYTNLIPPMIVYDHIDFDEEQDDATTRSKLFKNVVPSKKVAATKVFAESLRRENGTTLDQSTYENLLSNIGLEQRNPLAHQVQLKPIESDEENRESPDLVVNDSFGTQREFRKTLSDSFLDVPSQNSPTMKALAAPEDQTRPPGDPLLYDSSTHSSPVLSRKFTTSASVDGLETIGTDGDAAKVGKVGKSIWGFSPSAWKTLAPASRSNSPSLSPDKLSQLARRSNRSSDPDLTDLFDHDAIDGVQLVFQASRKGKLGLVIQCLDDLGPVVTQVKDYSPLLGQVLPGDRIVDIDGMSTSGMSLRDVTGLMGGKVAQSRWAASVFRIVVWRQNDDLLHRLDANPSSSALLLSDSPVTSERRTAIPRSMATPPRNRGATPPPPPSIPTLANKTPPRRRSTSLNRNERRLRSSSLTRREGRGASPLSRKRSSSLTRSERSEDSDSRRFRSRSLAEALIPTSNIP